MLYYFCTSFLCIVLCYRCAEPVVVEVVFLRELMVGTLAELQFGGGDPEGGKDGEKDKFVVLCSMLNEVKWCFEVVKECMDIWNRGINMACMELCFE